MKTPPVKMIDEARSALQAFRDAERALHDLRCRLYKHPRRVKGTDEQTVMRWLDRNDPMLRALPSIKNAFVKQLVRDDDSLLINGCFADGTVPKKSRRKRRVTRKRRN